MTDLSQFDNSLWLECDQDYSQHQSLFIRLQDEHQLNINLALLCRWLDKQNCFLSQPAWDDLHTQTVQWEQKVLHPYRQLRRLSKASLATDEYQQMLDVELMLERKSQGVILRRFKLMTEFGSEPNINHYLSLFNLNHNDFPALTC